MSVIDNIKNFFALDGTYSNDLNSGIINATGLTGATLTNCKISTDCLDPELLQRFDNIETDIKQIFYQHEIMLTKLDEMNKMIDQLYYPMRGEMK